LDPSQMRFEWCVALNEGVGLTTVP
jgi:hypothetical protein